MVTVKEELKMHLWNIITQSKEQTGVPTTIILAALTEMCLELKCDEMQEMMKEVLNGSDNPQNPDAE